MQRYKAYCTSIVAISMGIAGCATYTPKPLNTHVRLEGMPQVIERYQEQNNTANTLFDLSKGLDGYQLAVLSIFNNPELKSARADANVSHAQLFAAGLFPDPVINYSLVNTIGSIPGNTQGYGTGIGYDLSSLWFHGLNETIAQKEAGKVDLAVIWLEWQSVAAAMMLYSQSIYLDKQSVLLSQYRSFYASQLQSARTAYEKSLLPIDVITAETVLLDGVQKNIYENEQQMNKVSHEMSTLIGIDSTAKIPIKRGLELRTISDTEINDRLEKLDDIRPDLMALRIGYDAQEERVRKAVLSQFPAIGLNYTHAKDTTALTTGTIGITLTLPLFERGRGAIAIVTASRKKLFEEYEARRLYARNEIDKILRDRRLLLGRKSELVATLKNLEEAKEGASKAFVQGDVDQPTYIRYVTVLLDKEMEYAQVQQSIQEMNIALYLLCGKIDWNKGN